MVIRKEQLHEGTEGQISHLDVSPFTVLAAELRLLVRSALSHADVCV